MVSFEGCESYAALKRWKIDPSRKPGESRAVRTFGDMYGERSQKF